VIPTALVALVAATPSPSPARSVPDPASVSPGFAGFLAIFALALATVLLIRSMTGRLRRLRYREEPPDGTDEG
jgi:hypothetical protein